MHGAPQPNVTGRPEPNHQAVPGEAVPSQWEIPVLMSVPDLSREVPAPQLASTPKQHDKQPSQHGLSSHEFKLSLPPVATLGGLIGVAIVLVLVLLSRGGDDTAKNPTEAPWPL